MASLGSEDVATAGEMKEQHKEYQEGAGKKTQTVEESASSESKSTTVGETTTVEETTTVREIPKATTVGEMPKVTTVGEMPKATTVEEHNIAICTASISAKAMTSIAERIAASDSASVDMDYSVTATLGSSVDGQSVRTEDFAEEEAFIEESSKESEVDCVELAAADDGIEEKDGLSTGEITEMTEGLNQVSATSMTTEIRQISAETELEMDCLVAATLGSSADADSVLSADGMCDSTDVDCSETTEALVEDETLKSGYISTKSDEDSASIEVVADISDIDAASSEFIVYETSLGVTTPKIESVIEETSQDVTITEPNAIAEINPCVTPDAIGTHSDSSEVEISDLAEVLSGRNDDFHALTTSFGHEAEVLEPTHPKKFSSMITRFAEQLPLKTGPHRTDSAAKLELNSPSPVENIVHNIEVHETVSPQTHRTPSATRLDLSGSSPVKNVVHRLETHEEENNALESLKIRTKRDFFSEKGRTVSVSHEKEKYNAQMAQRAKKEAEPKDQIKSPAKKHSPFFPKSSALSSVRNMASRFEKKAEQSLDNLSFRTVRSFFPTEKSIHVGAEKQKYEALEKGKQSAKEPEEKFAKRMFQEQRTSSDVATILTETSERATEEPLAEDTVVQETPSMGDMSSPTKYNETTTLEANRTRESYPRRHTVTTKAESQSVRGIANRFETKRANSVVTAPVRTIDTFIVADSEASVRVSAEKAKYENQVKTSAPTKRTIDTFIVPKSEASVCVSAEMAKFETPQKLVKATVRTIDTFIVPDSEASVRVSAEKAKFESPEQQTQLTGPVVRTIDTFIVPESQASVRVATEKAKLEALEKQKLSELEVQASIVKQKLERKMSLAWEKAKLEEASQLKKAEDFTRAREVIQAKVAEETEVAKKMEVTMKAEAVKEIEMTKETEVVLETKAALEIRLASEAKVVMQEAEETREREMAADTVMTEEVGVGLDIGVGKDEGANGASKTREVTKTKGEGEKTTKGAAVVEEASQAEEVKEMNKMVEEIEKVEVMIIDGGKEPEVVTSIKEVNVTEEVDDVVQESKEAEVFSERASEEKQKVPNLTTPVVEVVVERQTFGDAVSTAQHVHWLSLPVSVNPALARLHTVLNDHDPLTAYALYPSNPPSPSSRNR